MNEKFPAGYTQRMEDLSKEADAAFARKHGWAPGDQDRLFTVATEHEGSHMLKHRAIPEVYREYGLKMIQKGSERAQPSLKTWMKETASQPSSAAVSLQNTPTLGPKDDRLQLAELFDASPSDDSEARFCAGQLILSNLGHSSVSPLAHPQDSHGQEERLLRMQKDVAMLHEVMGVAPSSQNNSRAGSRVSSLSHSVANSPALAPAQQGILNETLLLTPAQTPPPVQPDFESPVAEPPPASTILAAITPQKTRGVNDFEQIMGDYSPKRREWAVDNGTELRYSPYVAQRPSYSPYMFQTG